MLYPSLPRTLRLLLTFLLFGALATVLVAWSLAAWSSEYDYEDERDRQMRRFDACELLTLEGASDPAAYMYYSANYQGLGWIYFTWGNPEALRLYGWPHYALYSDVERNPSGPGGTLYRWEMPLPIIIARGLNTSDLEGYYHLGFFHAQYEHRLALLPLWRGFLIDTLFYAAVVAFLYYLLQPLFGWVLAPYRRWRTRQQRGFPVEIRT